MPLSRRTFNQDKRYHTVVLQENTTPADFELVESQDIQNAERRAVLTDVLSDGALGTGFRVVGDGSSNAVLVDPGNFLSAGTRLLLPDIQHPLVLGQFVFNMPIVTPVTDRTDMVYIDQFEETVTPTQDPDIEDPLLGPTALRERTVYAFRVAEGSTVIPALPMGHVGHRLATIIRRGGDPAINAEDVTDVRQIARLQDELVPSNLVVVAESGGQFTDLQTAIDSITGSSQSNPFTILVEPGEYTSRIPVTMNKPWVTLMGLDPRATTVKVAPLTGVLQAFVVTAAGVTIRDIALDIDDATTGNMVLLTQGAGLTTRLSNCILGEQFFDSLAANIMKGVEVGAGATLEAFRCRIFGQQVGAGINNPSGAVRLRECLVSCHVVHALVGSGTYVLDDCEVVTNERTISVLGAFTARRTSFTTMTTKAVPGVSANCISLGGLVTNRLEDCTIASNINRIDVVDNSLLWYRVELNARMLLSGGGSSRFQECRTAGVEIQVADAEFTDCVLVAQLFNFGSLAAFAIPVGVGIFGGAEVLLHGCRNFGGENMLVVDASNPYVQDCRILLSSATTGILMDNGSLPVITGTVFKSGISTALAANILDVVSNPTFAHCHFQKPDSGPNPSVFVTAGVGSQALTGYNTASAGVTAFHANITVTTIAVP